MARNDSMRASEGRSRDSNGNGSHTLYNDLLALAGGLMRNRKESSADALGSLASATREYAGKLDMPTVSTYVSSAADQFDYLADYVVENNLEDMIEDAGSFARRHPVAAFGMAAVAGYGLTRMMGLHGDSRSRGNGSYSRSTGRSSRSSSGSSGSRQGSQRGRNRRGGASASAHG